MPTISGAVIQNACRVPDREAVLAGTTRWTWAELDRRCAHIAAALERAGVQRGDRVAVTATNSPAYIAVAFAALRLGAIVIPVNTRFDWSPLSRSSGCGSSDAPEWVQEDEITTWRDD
ncbi:AMP-binding protein, partial [Nocardia sp. NPDC059236]|uniref:AMP-binding protein n=1 Tax=Nocardia sp. NPDC059236 TaxID=3346783 RepID=UPI0036C10A80